MDMGTQLGAGTHDSAPHIQTNIPGYGLLAGAPDTTYRLITTNPGFQLQRTYSLTLIT